MLDGIFKGYVQRVGKGWSGDLLIADLENLQKILFLRNPPQKMQAYKRVDRCDSSRVFGQRRKISLYDQSSTSNRKPQGTEIADEDKTVGNPRKDPVDESNEYWTVSGDFIYRHNAGSKF